MVNNKLKFIFKAFAITIIIISIIVISYTSNKPSITEADISIKGVLQLNNTGEKNYKEYVINVEMNKNKNCSVALYPYIAGLGQMSFSNKDKDSYYVPGSIGSDGVTEPIAVNELKSKNIMERNSKDSLTAFWFPYEAGKYKTRIYMEKLDDFVKIKNPVLVCVFNEEKFGKQFTWSKIIPVKYE